MSMLISIIIVFIICAALLVLLSGCSGRPSDKKFEIKAYSGGQVVRTFEGINYISYGGRIYVYTADGHKQGVGGSFSMHRTDEGATKNNSLPFRYRAELYSGGKVVEQINASSFTGKADGYMYINVSDSAAVIIGGTYIIRNFGVNFDGVRDTAKFKVTVYSDGNIIATFYADRYNPESQIAYLTISEIEGAAVVSGTYTIEQFR